MNNGLVVVALVALACGSLAAQVTPSYSSITSEVGLSLTGDNGSDADVVIDDQAATLGPLSADAIAGFSNSNGVFDGSVNGSASFSDASSGSFIARSSFMGADSGLPGAMGSFGHTLSSEFEYQFIIDGEGTLEIDGVLTNSSTVFESFILLSMSSESTIGGGFFGFFYNESITDAANTGSVSFTRSIPLEAPSGSYRLRVLISSSGSGQRDQEQINASVDASFQIFTDAACPADLNGDGVLDFFDVSAFLTAFNSMDPIADLTGDGVFDFFDVSAFLSAYGSGCP